MMFTKKIFLGLMISLSLFSFAQGQFFNKKDLMKTGVYYYPEHWPKEQWDRDLKKMSEMGFEFTHYAEFAWAMLEPIEGKYDFTWLDEAVRLADKNGLKVIMCTPTPTPPAWMSKKYPEILLVKDDGVRAEHGTRAHISWSSQKYRQLVEKIVLEMAKKYGNDKRIWGWQIDNEPSHYGTEDYHPEAKIKFQAWLKAKYQNIEALNKAWGTAFWSMTFQSFDQVFLPNSKTQISGMNPHAWLDFKRFSAIECADFVGSQASILRKNISKDQWITTNFMHFHDKVDPWLNDRDLDFMTYTMYPVGGGYSNWGGLGEQGFRVGIPSRMAFANDFFRYKKGFTGVMELQPGQVNWGQYNPQVYPGIIRAWLWNAYVGGCNLACSYRFRQPLYGSEQYHHGMLGTDGVTPSVGGLEYSKFMKELKDLRKVYNSAEAPKDMTARKTAILWNFDNFWETQVQAQTNQWNMERTIFKQHGALKSLGCSVDFISEDMDFSKYSVIIATSYQLLDQKLVDKWKNYVQNGGNLILTTRTGQKDKNAILWEKPYGAAIEELTGAKLIYYDVLPLDKMAKVKMNDKVYEWNNWADIFEPKDGTEILATYDDQYYKGKAAVVTRKLGKGSVTYIGPDTDDTKLEKDVFKQVFKNAKISTLDLPEGLIMDWRDGFWIAINYHTDKVLDVPVPDNAKILIGQKKLNPAEVVVWTEK